VREAAVIARPTETLSELYEKDETAWLDAMAELSSLEHCSGMDLPNLREYLTDMAASDRREVYSRLAVLLTHFLKWEFQPELRGNSWRGTIREQRRELRLRCASGTLWNHAEAVLLDAYSEALLQAADETGLPLGVFPTENSWTLTHLLASNELPD